MEPDREQPIRIEPVRVVNALRGFEGKWVALRDGRVVAAQDTFDRLYTDLHQRRILGATILRAPAEGEPEMVGLG